jgi:hypothetical protein
MSVVATCAVDAEVEVIEDDVPTVTNTPGPDRVAVAEATVSLSD